MDEERDATPEEARAISAYSGWGGAANAFAQNPTGGWAAVSQELKELLSEDEFAEQRATVLTAFYTPRPVVELIWETLRGAASAMRARQRSWSRAAVPATSCAVFRRAWMCTSPAWRSIP